jgi:hypothetical protein
MTAESIPPVIADEESLEEILSRPYPSDVEFLKSVKGDILILGAGGKMGPSLAWRARRAADQAGISKNVMAVSRFSSHGLRDWFEQRGIRTIPCDLMDPRQLEAIPECENVFYLAGRKFGSSGRPDLTWVSNTLLPSRVAERFRHSRMVAFSTGNIYPLLPADSSGSVEEDLPGPVGEYAQSCLGRERVFEYFSLELGIRCLFYRLNYASDLRYGVLVDIAGKVREGREVERSVPVFNTLWQGDADSYALRSLEFCQSPPFLLNVTGPEKLTVEEAAVFFARRWNLPLQFKGEAGGAAWLSNAGRCHSLLGKPEVSAAQLLEWTAAWVERGGRSLGKPTKFEAQNGRF